MSRLQGDKYSGLREQFTPGSTEEFPKRVRLPTTPGGGSLESASHSLEEGPQPRPPIGQKGELRFREERELVSVDCGSERLGQEGH